MKGMLNSEDGIHEFFDVHGKSSQEVCDYVNSIINTLAKDDANYKVKVALIDDIYLHYKPDEKHLVRYGMIKNLEKAAGECIAKCRDKKILLIGQFAPDWIATFALNNAVTIWHDSAEQVHNYEYDPIDESLTYVNEFKEILDMDFDIIIANPPYDIGNKITRNIVENISFDKYINLMPLSCYKGGKLYRNVDNLEVVDPKLFEDASITNNLCIAVVDKEEKDIEWSEFEMQSFDQRFIEFYKANSSRSSYIIDNFVELLYGKTRIEIIEMLYKLIDSNSFCIPMRASNGIQKSSGDSFNVRWNIKHDVAIEDIGIDGYEGSRSLRTKVMFIPFRSIIEFNNFSRYWYNAELSDKLIKGLNKTSGSIKIAIPQIDWSRTDVEYTDDYVLEQMGLRWNANKNGVERI